MTKRKIFISLMTASLGFFFSANVAKAQVVSKTKMAGKVSVTMKSYRLKRMRVPVPT